MLPNILDKGVLLWMMPDGLYAKRLCQGRVYWEGPLAPYVDKPNKLEKEQPSKLFDTQQFLIGKLKLILGCSVLFTPTGLDTVTEKPEQYNISTKKDNTVYSICQQM